MPGRLGRQYPVKRTPPDHRDLGVARLAGPVILPPKTDLSPDCDPVQDQGAMGSCTSFASAAMLSFNYSRYKAARVQFSQLFQYYQERVMDGTFPQDAGSTGRTAVRCMNQFGICLESELPYDQDGAADVPTASEVTSAQSYKSGAYHFISNVQDMKACLASGYVFIIGFTVYDSFESDAMAATGLMPVPDKSTESVLGGHEVVVVGYDDTVTCPGASSPGAFKVKNSWGTGWGIGGYFFMPYQVMADPDILMDAIIQHFGKPW